jgi:hypothetical protein
MTASANPLAPRGTRAGFRICGACGARIADDAWTSLVLSRRIEAPELRAIISGWPDDYCIEVRSCDGCGGLVASKCLGGVTASQGDTGRGSQAIKTQKARRFAYGSHRMQLVTSQHARRRDG